MTTNGYVPPALKVSPRALPEIQQSDHELVKEKLRPGLDKWCQHVLDGLDATPCAACGRLGKPSRTSMNMMPKVFRLIGAEQEININLATMQVWGMPADEVQRIIEAHRQSSATTIEQCLEYGVALLMFVFEQEPHLREAARARLFGGGNVLALAETNGTHSNGTDQAS